jgi:hypothetical protein
MKESLKIKSKKLKNLFLENVPLVKEIIKSKSEKYNCIFFR